MACDVLALGSVALNPGNRALEADEGINSTTHPAKLDHSSDSKAAYADAKDAQNI